MASFYTPGAHQSRTVPITLTAGTTYYFIVDGGDYQVSGTGSELPPQYALTIQ
jgi:hypothetical protein